MNRVGGVADGIFFGKDRFFGRLGPALSRGRCGAGVIYSLLLKERM